MRHLSTWNLRTIFATFHPIFKNTLVSKTDIGDLLKNYADEEGLLSRSRKLLISSFSVMFGYLLLFNCCFTYNWVSLARYYTAWFNAIQRIFSTALYTQQ